MIQENEIPKKMPLIIALCLVLVIIFLMYGCSSHKDAVTTETQNQAETPAGVDMAADNANVPLTPDQAKTATKEIRYIYTHDTKPAYTIVTTGAEAVNRSESARKTAGADFAIVTNKQNPEANTDLNTIPAAAKVELNQYNVQAYKKELHTIEVSPGIDGNGKTGVAEIGYIEQFKISKDGKYIGIGVSYNIDEHKTMAKIAYTW